jgi:hypothetical protein
LSHPASALARLLLRCQAAKTDKKNKAKQAEQKADDCKKAEADRKKRHTLKEQLRAAKRDWKEKNHMQKKRKITRAQRKSTGPSAEKNVGALTEKKAKAAKLKQRNPLATK